MDEVIRELWVIVMDEVIRELWVIVMDKVMREFWIKLWENYGWSYERVIDGVIRELLIEL